MPGAVFLLFDAIPRCQHRLLRKAKTVFHANIRKNTSKFSVYPTLSFASSNNTKPWQYYDSPKDRVFMSKRDRYHNRLLEQSKQSAGQLIKLFNYPSTVLEYLKWLRNSISS